MDYLIGLSPALLIAACFAYFTWAAWRRDKKAAPTHICSHCLSTVRPVERGSYLILFVLFLFFVIPGIVYAIWSSTSAKACPVCKALNPVPIQTPAGQQLANQRPTA